MDIFEKKRIVKNNILEIFKEHFQSTLSDEEILVSTPKDNYPNFHQYYEAIVDIFLIEPENASSIVGTVNQTIETVAELWETTPHSFFPWEEVF